MYNSDETYSRIVNLLHERGETAKAMCTALNIGINTVHQLRERPNGLTSATLYAIADYLDVSADYLLGRTDKPEVNR